jgi:hypothetical protein
MKKQYYYLVSVLPSLVFGKKTPLSSVKLKNLCMEHLDPVDYGVFQAVMDDLHGSKHKNQQDIQGIHKCIHEFYDEWKTWDSGLRNELAAMRKAAVSDRKKSLKSSLSFSGAFRDALGKDNKYADNQEYSRQIINAADFLYSDPLNAETVLASIRWNHIDGMEFGHYFDFEKITAYALKLGIMERLESFDQSKGWKIFMELLDYETEHWLDNRHKR